MLTIDSGNTDDVRRYISAVKKRGFNVLAPDINRSTVDFTIDGDNIIFGVSGVKGVGKTVSNKILRRRPKKNGYKGLGHFVMRNLDVLNKKVLEQYAKAGLFSSFDVNKESALNSVRAVLEFMDRQKAVSEYNTIFDMVKKIDLARYVDSCKIIQTDVPDDLLYEIETLGFYITKHPLEDTTLDTSKAMSLTGITNLYHDNRFLAVGAICSIDIRKTRAKTNMATFDLTTAEESIRCTIFPRSYADFMDLIEEGKVVVVKGSVKEEEESKTFIANQIFENYESYLLVKEAKVDNFINWIDIDKVVSSKPKKGDELGVAVNSHLSYILKR